MKLKLAKKMADLAIGITKTNVNSTCVYILHQSKLPLNSDKLKNNKK